MSVAFSEAFERFCIVWNSYSSSSIFPSFQSDNYLASVSRCSLEDLLGEVIKLASWTTFSAINSYDVLFAHRLKRRVV